MKKVLLFLLFVSGVALVFATTLEELRTLYEDINPKVYELFYAAEDLKVLLDGVGQDISNSNPFSSAINVDPYVAIQTPLYLEKLTRIETAADALGTDALH